MSDKKFHIALVYDSGKRYIIPIDIVKEILTISDEDIKKIETEVLRHVAKGE